MKSLFNVLAVLVLALTVSVAFADRFDGNPDNAGDAIDFDVTVPCVNIMDARARNFPDFTFVAPTNAGEGFGAPTSSTGNTTPRINFDYTSNCAVSSQNNTQRRITMAANIGNRPDLRGLQITMTPNQNNTGTVNARVGTYPQSIKGGAIGMVLNHDEANVEKAIITRIKNVAVSGKRMNLSLGTTSGLALGRSNNQGQPHTVTLTFTLQDAIIATP